MNTVFLGEQGIRDFLDPFAHPYTPLVELSRTLNPFRDHGIRLYAKLLHMLPLGNVKSLPAFQMLQHIPSDVDRIVESSSGNTVASLAVLARHQGVSHTKAYVSHDVSLGKLRMLQLFGVEVEVQQDDICPDPMDPHSAINRARTAGKKPHIFNPDQYSNEANPQAHYLYTGPQIYDQLQGQISMFVSGLGTTGTATGTGRYLKEQNKMIHTLGVVRSPNNPVPGVRTAGLLRHIDFDWNNVVDETVTVGTSAAFQESLSLIQRGIVVGPSSGFALAGVKAYLQTLIETDQLHLLPEFQKERHVVFVCCDTPYPYLEEYFRYLPPESFPSIQNGELLRQDYFGEGTKMISQVDVSPEEMYMQLFSDTGHMLDLHTRIIDIRPFRDFDAYHIPGAEHLPYEELRISIEEFRKQWSDHCVFIVCEYGLKSAALADWFQHQGLRTVFSLQGGMVAWSDKKLPRKKTHSCIWCETES